MRFFTSGANKSNTPLYTAFGFFIFFLFLFWAGSFIYFGAKYSFSTEGIADYFFGPVEFPQTISVAQLTEEVHINIFLISVLILSISGFLLNTTLSSGVKTFLISILFITGLADNLNDFAIVNTSREVASIKLITFSLFQLFMIISVVFITIDYLKGRMEQKYKNFLYYNKVIWLFSLFSMVIAAINFYLFNVKIGFSPAEISTYYNGNEKLFINPKSFAGMVEVAVPHFAAIGIFLVALTHFISFTAFKYKNMIIFTLFLSALADIFSSFTVRFISPDFSIIKVLSFFIFQVSLIFGSVVLFYYSYNNKVFTPATTVKAEI